MRKIVYALISLSIFILIMSSSSKEYKFNQKQIEVNKNYAFCLGLYTLNVKNGISDYNLKDGSIEVYFIDSLLVLDVEDAKSFVKSYLDSLDQASAYRSYANHSLNIAKCLDLYNSKRLDDFVKQKIKESKKN